MWSLCSHSLSEDLSPCCKLHFKLKEINAFDYLDSSIESGNGFSDPVYETFDSLGENKENDAEAWLLLISLDKWLKDRNRLHYKVSQLQNTEKENSELSDKIDWLQMRINSLKVLSLPWKRVFSPAARVQVVGKQTQVLIMRLAELQRKLKSLPQRVSGVKVRTLIGKEGNPVLGVGVCGRTIRRLRTLNLQILKGLSHVRK